MPYSLSAFSYKPGNESQVTWTPICDKINSTWYTWQVAAPINTDIIFQLKDSNGMTIFSQTPLNVISNERGRAADTWCLSDSDDDTLPTSSIPGHNYAINATDVRAPATPTATRTTSSSDSVPTKDEAFSDVIASEAHRSMVVEGVLAALVAVTAVALAVVIFLFFRLRRRYHKAQTQLHSLPAPNKLGAGFVVQDPKYSPDKAGEKRSVFFSGKGKGKGKSGKSRMWPSRKGGRGGGEPEDLLQNTLQPQQGDAFDVITPTADTHLRNPFEEAVAAVRSGDDRFFLAPGPRNEDRYRRHNSTTSLVSDTPSSNQGSTRTGASGISTEYYHRTKASTIPPKAPAAAAAGYPPLAAVASSPSSSGHSSTLRDGSTNNIASAFSRYGPKSPSIDTVETVIVPISRVSSTTGSSHSSDFTEDYDEASRSDPESRRMSFSGQSWGSSMHRMEHDDATEEGGYDDDDEPYTMLDGESSINSRASSMYRSYPPRGR